MTALKTTLLTLIGVTFCFQLLASSNGFVSKSYELFRHQFLHKLAQVSEDCGQSFGFSPFFLPEICNNGIDDDADGLVDGNDPDCGADATILVPTGSFIINMGVQPQTVANAIKPYGLVWHLLHLHEVPVVWSINPNKTKDGIDFTYNGVAYKGGPFIVLGQYRTPEVNALIANWQAQGVVGVTTTSDINVPLNRILSYSMNWTLESSNGQIAKAYLDRAGIPSTAYNWTLPNNLNCCNDVFLMPHTEPSWATHNGLLNWNASPSLGGCAGALWAGCKSGSEVENLVNPSNPAQRMNFLMSPPIAPSNTPAVWSDNHSDGTLPYSYFYPVHPVMQFLGTMDGAQENGAEQIYLPRTGWRPTTFLGITDPDHPQIPSVSPGAAAKLVFGPSFGDQARGYVMYQAGHRLDKANAAANIAAQRAFFNFSMMAVGQKAIKVVSNVATEMESGTPYNLSASATGGSGNYLFHWETDCGGIFSNPYSSTTSYTPPQVLVPTTCFIKATITDDCGTRIGFQNTYITLMPQPAPPVAVNDEEATQPGVSIIVNAIANDSDPNHDPLVLTLLGASNTGHGLFVNSGNGSVTYTPNFDFVGLDQINYQICDNTPPAKGGPLCDTATIFITVDWIDAHGCYPNQFYGSVAQGNATAVLAQNSISNPTQALGLPVLVANSSAYYAMINADADYLALDLGYDVPIGDTIWLYIGSDDGASATLRVQGTLTSTAYALGTGFYDLQSYTTNKDLNTPSPQQDVVAYVPTTGAVRRLRFTRSSGAGRPSVNGVRYEDKNCISAVPVANNDAVTLCEDNTVDIDVLANDDDPQDFPLSVSIVTPPVNGFVTVLTDGSIRYKPNADYSGSDNFIYQACNSKDLCDQATVSITVYDDSCPPGYYKVSVGGVCSGSCILSPNNPPDAVNDHATTPINTPVTVTVQSNDLDPSGLGITTSLGLSNPPDNGTVVLVGNKIKYTPNIGFAGADEFNYKICNPYGCDSALVTVDVLCADPGNGRAIQGMVFNDVNRNAAFNTGESGVGNVRVRLYKDLNTNGQLDAGEISIDSTLTNEHGSYVFNIGNGTITNSSATTYYAIAATGSVEPGFPLPNATAAPNGSFVKMGKDKHLRLEFANTIPLGATVSVYLASDKKKGKATISSSLNGTTFSNPMVWEPTYTNDPGNPPSASAIEVFSYQVAATGGVKFIKIERDAENIYVDGASWKQTTSTGASTSVSLSRTIGASSDDAEEEGVGGSNLGVGGMYLFSTDLEITQDMEAPASGSQKIGLRFNTLNIPNGATITGATLSFKAIAADAPNTNNGATALTIKGQAADHAATFTTATNNISNRTLTTASTSWNPGNWTTGTTYTSPDLKDIVQEIVNRPGWTDGNSMAFVISGTGSRSASSYDGGAANAPVLNITYKMPTTATTTLPATEDVGIWIGPGGTTNNYGNCNILYLNGAPADRSLIKFNLSGIPDDATIISANLRLVKIGGSNTATNFSVHRITNNWTEGTGTCTGTAGVCNWNQRQAGTNWTTAGGDFNTTAEATISVAGNGIYNWNIPGMVQNWVSSPGTNYGVLLKFTNEAGTNNEMQFASSENATIANRPQLEVIYTIPSLENHYVLQLDPSSFPINSNLTTDNLETAVVLNNGDVDCANNFGLLDHLPPIANPDTTYMDAGTTATINVILNDSDPEGTPLTMTFLTNPPAGTATNNGNGTLDFTPNNGFTGWQTFLYTVCDQGVPTLCDTTSVSIFVNPFINENPVAQNDYDTTVVNGHVETDVLINDFDQEYDVLTASLSPGILQPANGTVEVVNGTLVEYTPNPGFTGNDAYQYIVCDQHTPSLCDTATVFIHVVNRPPIAHPDYRETQINTPVNIPVLNNDVELDGHGLVLLTAGNNALLPNNGLTNKGGTVTVNNNGTPANYADDFITYTPPNGFLGLDSFEYRIRDTGLPNGFDITFVEIKITPPIDLELTKTVNPANSSIGLDVTFTLSLLNRGPNTATDVRTIERLPASYQYISDNGGGSYDLVSGVWYVPTLGIGQTATLAITARILNAAALKNVTEVIAADQKDVDSTPNNDDGDQSEDDESSATTVLVEICGNSSDDDGDGLTDCADPECYQNLSINAGPDAFVCTDGSVTLTTTTSGGAGPFTFQWSNGLGNISNPTASPLATTTYTVTVTNTNGCTATDQVVVTVVADPAITSQPTGFTECVGGGQSLSVSATGGTPSLIYQWQRSTDNVTFTNISGATSANHTPTSVAQGVTYYRVVVSALGNGCGTVTSNSVAVTIVADPTIINPPANTSICPGNVATLSVIATGGTPSLTYQWQRSPNGIGFSNINGATSSTYTTPTLSSTAHYRVVVSAGGNGCGSVTSSVATVSMTSITANAGADWTICNGSSASLSANANGATSPYTYAWNQGLGAGQNKTVTPGSNTNYRVTVTSSDGCTATDQVAVIVSTRPTVNAGADRTICLNSSSTITATASGGGSPHVFAWSHGLGTGASKSVSPTSTTTYTVTVTSDNGCINTDQVIVTVQNCPEVCNNGLDDDGDGLADCADLDCGPQADLGGDLSICQGSTANLSVSVVGGSGNLNYAWSHGLGNGQTKAVSPTANTTYSVTITSQSGCSDVDQVTVTVTTCTEICTNGIDDDGDGLVDCADPGCAGITAPILIDDTYDTCPNLPYTDRVTYNDGNLQNPTFSIVSQPANGLVSIDWTGKFTYTPSGIDCFTDVFEYQACNTTSGCCSRARVTMRFNDNMAPVLTNVPADLTIGCDDSVPPPGVVTAFDQCPGVYVDFNETSNQHFIGACGSYTITRTWVATDLCGNSSSDQQLITVLDQTKPEIFQVYTLANGTKVVAGIAQRVTHDWKHVRFPIAFSQPPIVLSQIITNADQSAVVVQQRNILSQGFEMRLREEELADNRHNNEQVAWIAIESGTQSGDLTFQANTLSNVNNVVQTLGFQPGFQNEPLLFTMLQTTNEQDPANLRHSNLSANSVDVFIQEETSNDVEVSRINETIGFLALGQGSVLKDKNGEVFGETGTLGLTNAWSSVNLTRHYTKPVVIIGGLTNQEGDPVTVRVRNLGQTGFQVRLQEWDYLDGNHSSEAVSWMVVEGSIPGNGAYYCSSRVENLVPGVNLFAVDNCDALVAFGTDKYTENQEGGILNTRTWTAMDDCGNISLITRYDTCQVAAVKVAATLYGAMLNNGNNPLMRDNLRNDNLVPVREPYSKLAGFPHVEDHSKHYVTICQNPGTPGQQTMTIPADALQSHLNQGDAIGACVVATIAQVPDSALSATYKTVADGDWENPSTWLNGQVPPFPLLNGVSVSITHDVIAPAGNAQLSGNTKIWVTNGSLVFPDGNVKMSHYSQFHGSNSTISVQNGYFDLWTGNDVRLSMKDCDVNISGDFGNWTGARKLENVTLNVGGNFNHDKLGTDSLINVTMTVQGHLNNTKQAQTHFSNCRIKLVNGNLVNEILGTVTGQNNILWIENGNFTNLGLWLASFDQYCIGGSFTYIINAFPLGENCLGIASNFSGNGSTLDATVVQPDPPGPNDISPAEIAGPGTIDPAMLETTGSLAVVDWVLVEIRNPANDKEVLGYATAVVLRDGSILNEDGLEPIVFEYLPAGEYYVALRHRNHLGMMTETPVSLSTDNPPLIDFSDPTLPVKGGTFAGRSSGTKRALWAGDFNADRKVIYQGPNNDVFYLFSRVLSEEDNEQNLANFIVVGYESQDLNLDGKVIFQGPNNDRAPLLYHTVLAHNGNSNLLANYIVSGLLP